KEGAQVRHPILEHSDAIDAQAPGEALIFVGIEPAIAQHIRMHHPATENFQPILALAKTDLALLAPALNIDFERGFGEGKVRWTYASAVGGEVRPAWYGSKKCRASRAPDDRLESWACRNCNHRSRCQGLPRPRSPYPRRSRPVLQ